MIVNGAALLKAAPMSPMVEARCDVHHRVPKAHGGLHTLANAVVLCPNCHRIEHEAGNAD